MHEVDVQEEKNPTSTEINETVSTWRLARLAFRRNKKKYKKN